MSDPKLVMLLLSRKITEGKILAWIIIDYPRLSPWVANFHVK